MAEFLFLFQFQKNKYDLQATKNKLVEAANYVDKVRPDIYVLEENLLSFKITNQEKLNI